MTHRQDGSTPDLAPQVILLIPTLESRNYLPDLLSSLVGHLTCFDKLILSVNGTSVESENLLAIRNYLPLSLKVKLWCTSQVLTAIEHLWFIKQRLCTIASDQDLVFLMADDDLMPVNFELKAYIEHVRANDGKCLGMGNFSAFTFNQEIPIKQDQHISPGEVITPAEFLLRNQLGHLFTCMSTMIIPFSVFDKACTWMYRLGSSGRRFEYILATHQNIHYLYSPTKCSALVRQHIGQAGKTLTYNSYLQDELIYILWIWKNQHQFRPWRISILDPIFSPIRFSKIAVKLILLKCFNYFFSTKQ